MNKGILIVFLCVIVATHAELKFVIELYRHGSRAPQSKYWDGSEQADQYGELNAQGMRMHYILGKQLRKEYIEDLHFLSPTFNHSEIFIRSSDVNRTIMSAQSQLYGMYPLGTGPQIPAGLDPKYTIPPYKGIQYEDIGNDGLPQAFQPVPIHIVSYIHDKVFFPTSYFACPNTENYQIEYAMIHHKMFNEINEHYEGLYQQLAEILEVPQNKVTMKWQESIYDVIISDMYNNRPLPPGLTDDIFQQLNQLNSLTWFTKYFGSQKVLQISATPTFEFFLKYLDKIVEQKKRVAQDLKWIMLSGHDADVAPIMAALNFTDHQCLMDLFWKGKTDALNCNYRPQYAANIILELHQDDQTKEFYIMIKYNGQYQNLCEKNNTVCSYTEFSNRLQNYMLSKDEFERVCGTAQYSLVYYLYNLLTGDLWVLLATLEFFGLIILFKKIRKLRKQQKMNIPKPEIEFSAQHILLPQSQQ